MNMQAENPTPETEGASIHDAFYDTPEDDGVAVETVSEDQQTAEAVTEGEVSEETGSESLESDAATEDQEQQLTTAEIASIFGVDESTLDVNDKGQVVIKTKVDGEEGTATFDDFLRSYQKQGHLDNKSREVNQLKDQLQEQGQQQQQAAAQQLQTLQQYTQIAQQELMADYQSINWEELRATDPGEFAAKQTDMQQKQQAISARMQAINAEQQKQYQSQQQQTLQEANKQLLKDFPEWADESVGKEAITSLRGYGETVGFTPDQMAGVIHSPMFKLLQKAKAFDELEKGKPELTKQVRKVLKVAKPGVSSKAQPKSDADFFYN